MAYSLHMLDAVTRSTFAYAKFPSVVLSAPRVGLSHHDATRGLPRLLPGGFPFLGVVVVLFVAVRHAMAGHAGAPFARGFARGAAARGRTV